MDHESQIKPPFSSISILSKRTIEDWGSFFVFSVSWNFFVVVNIRSFQFELSRETKLRLFNFAEKLKRIEEKLWNMTRKMATSNNFPCWSNTFLLKYLLTLWICIIRNDTKCVNERIFIHFWGFSFHLDSLLLRIHPTVTV